VSCSVLQIRPLHSLVRVEIGGYLLAESEQVLEVREPGNHPVLYFPTQSLRMARLVHSDSTSYCPRKGHASYYSIRVGSCFENDSVWYYSSPIHSAAALADHVAFRAGAVDAFDAMGTRLMGPALCSDCDQRGAQEPAHSLGLLEGVS
jgi:uncharacterized protein (DUF427 family)